MNDRIENLSETRFAYLVLAPTLVIFTAIALWPILYTLQTSLFADSFSQFRGAFVGLQNYVAILTGQRDVLLIRPFIDMSRPFRSVLPTTLISVSYFPGATFIVGLFKLMTGNVTVLGVSSPNLFNTPAAVGLPLTALTLPFAILILTTFYGQIPDGLEDAARVTGSSRIGALYRVIALLSAPGLVTAGVLTFITAYNEFFFSQLMTTGLPQDWSPIVWGLLRYQTAVSVRYDLMAAASLIGVLPVALLVLLAQRKIVSGLTSGSLKG